MSTDISKLLAAQESQDSEDQLRQPVLDDDDLSAVMFDEETEDDFDLDQATHVQELIGGGSPFNTSEKYEGRKGFFGKLFRQPDLGSSPTNYSFSGKTTHFGTAIDDVVTLEAEQGFTTFSAETNTIQTAGKISSKIIFALVSLILLSLTAAGLSTLYQVRKGIIQQISADRILQTQSIVDLTRAFFIEEIQPLEAIATGRELSNALTFRNQTYSGTQEEILANISYLDTLWQAADDSDPLIQNAINPELNQITETLSDFLARFPQHTEIFLTDRYGATLAATGRLSDYYQADEVWWQSAWNNGQGAYYISQPELAENETTRVLTVAFPIWDESESQIVGILRSSLNMTNLVGHIEEHSFGETGYAMLFNGQGDVLIDPGLARGQNAKQLEFSLRQGFVSASEGSEIGKSEQAIDTIFTYAKVIPSQELMSSADLQNQILTAVQKLDWSIVTRQSSSEALAVLSTVITWTIAMAAITLLIALVISTAIARSISKPIQQLALLAQQVAQGDLSQLAEVRSNDEVGYLGTSINTAIMRLRGMVKTEEDLELERQQREDLQTNISTFLDIAMDIAGGDLTKRGKVSEDVLGNVVDAINLMVEEVAYLLRDVQTAALSVHEGSGEMLDTTEAITNTTKQQTLEAQKARQDVLEVTDSIREMAQNAQISAQSAEQTLKASQQGQDAVSNTLSGMQNIRREVQAISKRIKNLGDRSLEISEIVDTIARISRQTNLLALNAAIEASGAGEAGRRFAIVADEVRKLADDSAVATRRIGELIKGVQAEVQEVVISVEDGTKEVEQGYRVATEAGERLKEIASISEQTAQLAQLISQATTAQVAGVEEVGSAVSQITGMAESAQSSVEQGRAVAERLQELSEQLTQSLERFRLA